MLSITALSLEQIDALQNYLDCLDERTRKRGLSYFEKALVKEVEPFKRGIGFRAEVMGTRLYRVKFRFTDDDWDGECSCPVLYDCKHCCAAALQVIADYTEATWPAEEDAPQPAAPGCVGSTTGPPE